MGLTAGVITIALGLFMLVFVRGGLLAALIPILGIVLFVIAMVQGKRLVKNGDKRQGKRIQVVAQIGFMMIMASLVIIAINLVR